MPFRDCPYVLMENPKCPEITDRKKNKVNNPLVNYVKRTYHVHMVQDSNSQPQF